MMRRDGPLAALLLVLLWLLDAVLPIAIVIGLAGVAVAEPVVKLTGYQKRWAEDPARFKIGRWARQTGKSFVTTLEAGLDMAEAGAPWVVLSAGERQSKKNVDTVAMHLRAIQHAAEVIEGEDEFAGSKFKTHEIRLSNGGWCIGLPANPDTARGWSANVLLDEFAFHADSRKIWAALFPTVTRGFKLRVVSTPQGKKNKFYELATNATYSQHVVTIEDAVADGLELRDEDGKLATAEELRAALGDDEAWSQEYLVEFLDEATAWLPYELISAAEDAALDATPDWIAALVTLARDAHRVAPTVIEPLPFEFPAPPGALSLGLDVARRRDLLVIWLNARRGDIEETWAVIALKAEKFGVAERVLYTLMSLLPVDRACIDETGMGMQLAERAKERFGESRVEPVTFTTAAKQALAVILKQKLQDRGFSVPVERVIRESFHSLKRIETSTGALRFDADRTEATGHGDHAWAAALALQASATPSGPIEFQTTGRKRAGFALDRWMGRGRA